MIVECYSFKNAALKKEDKMLDLLSGQKKGENVLEYACSKIAVDMIEEIVNTKNVMYFTFETDNESETKHQFTKANQQFDA